MLLKDFIEFLKQYKVLTLAIGFVMGGASTALVNSLVKDVIMPMLQPLLVSDWKDATLTMGAIKITYGNFLAELLNFLILALIIFLVTKKIIKLDKEEAKK
jgi:large conductance mechanosensitive channel